MEEKETKILSFEVSADEAQTITDAAKEAGISRSEYLRQRLFKLARRTPTKVPHCCLSRKIQSFFYIKCSMAFSA
jgi:hypothetical protein